MTCSVDPLRDVYESVREIGRCIQDLGMDAVKLYPAYDPFDPRDERIFPVYEKIIELDVPMQCHMGWTPCLNAPMQCQPAHLLDDVAYRGGFTPEENLKTIRRFGRPCGFDKLPFGPENSHTHMAVELMRGLTQEAGRLGVEPIADEDM